MAALQTLASPLPPRLDNLPSESRDRRNALCLRIVAGTSIGGIQRPKYYQGLGVTIGTSPDAIFPLAYFITNASRGGNRPLKVCLR